jgi:hypothetical protein
MEKAEARTEQSPQQSTYADGSSSIPEKLLLPTVPYCVQGMSALHTSGYKDKMDRL